MKRNILRRFLSILIACSLLSGCARQDLGKGSLSSPVSNDAETAFELLENQWFKKQMESDPFSCHFSIANPTSYGISMREAKFSDLTYEEFKRSQKEKKLFLKELKQIPYQKLSSENQFVYDILYDYYALQCEFDDYYYYADPLSPTSGIPASLPALLSAFRFDNTEDIQLYFLLLDDVDIYFEQLSTFAEEKEKRGLLQNENGMGATITFCKDFSKAQPDHLLLLSFEERINNCDFLGSSEKQKYITTNRELVCDVVLPSYLSLSNRLSSLSIDEDPTSCLCHLPKGHNYYSLLTKSYTGCEDSPFVLYQRIAKKREADLEKMSGLFSSHPSLATSISNVQCPIDDPKEMIDMLRDSISNDYPACPSANIKIQEISPQLAAYSAPAFYIIAPLDACDNHTIYYNPKSFSSSLDLFTTMAHEGYPGHLYQTCMSYTNDYAPVRLLLSHPGYVEGWATYIESESYLYAGLPAEVAQVLSLNQGIVLSLYASSDIGIHYYGWDKKKLLEFLSNYGIHDKNVASQIYQLILNDPANYLKYYVGYMNFLDLREECQEKYPGTFSRMDFHKCILQAGPCPFPILRDLLFDYFDNIA